MADTPTQLISEAKEHASSEIVDDVHCISCAYNLRGILQDGNCPECGIPIERSLWGDLLGYADTRWLRQLRFGLLAHQFGAITAYASMVIGIIERMFRDSHKSSSHSIVLDSACLWGIVVGLCIGLIGCWMMAVPEPRESVRKSIRNHRTIIRFLSLAAPISISGVPFFLFGPLRMPPVLLRIIVPVLYGICILSCLLLALTMTTRFAVIADRIPDHSLALRGRRLRDHFGLIGGVCVLASLMKLGLSASGLSLASSSLASVLDSVIGITFVVSFIWLFPRYILLISATRKAVQDATLFGGISARDMVGCSSGLGVQRD